MGAADTDIFPEQSLPGAPAATPWPLLAGLAQRLAAGGGDPAAWRALLREAHEELKARFFAAEPVEELVLLRSALIDAVLRAAWQAHCAPACAEWALVAVGGYGRGELHPCSDVDVLLLAPPAPETHGGAAVEKLVAFLWDIGLEVGHSVRSVAQCAEECVGDVGVMTTLLEARLLAGNVTLFGAMRVALAPERIWPVKQFFEAKVREQAERHLKANDTAYNLEPNVKTGPGGLRDIQTIAWVAKRHFGADTLDGLVTHGFLTAPELRRLRQAQAFLWRVRFGLHAFTGRREDRLLFDHQIRLALAFGYEDASYTLAVEQFMQRYYRTVMDVSLLNELLLQLFREAILTESEPPRPLNARFQVRNGSLEAVHDEVFARTPSALLEMFALLQQNPEIRGVRASTMRAVARNLWLIDEEFRQNPRHHRLFLEILRSPVGVTHELRRMNTYGVLGRYIPAFGRVVGRMQYDLFHAYTVDAHTLFVVSNLRRFAIPRYDHELPEASRVMQQLPRQEIAYLAALFHDLAKGRGGDHSELGAVDAEAFCLEQGLSPYDARLVAWLVRNHLELSITSQKQDIGDPQVINAFARKVGDEAHLDYLYVLTCADVRGTNPKLWNSWKASLFKDFYQRVKRALRRGLESPIDPEHLVRETQDAARRLLIERGVGEREIAASWTRFSAGYFLQHSPEEVAWHTRLLAERDAGSDEPLVALDAHSVRGTTAVLVFTRPRRHGFARTTAVLDQLGLNIVDARITPTGDGFSLDLYHVLEDDGQAITDSDRQVEIEQALWRSVQGPADAPLSVSRRAPRQARMFNTPTQIALSVDERNHRSVLELTAGDRPGLLSDVGKVLVQERVELHAAKIMTVGERAEDVFYLADFDSRPLSGEAAERLRERLLAALDREQQALRASGGGGAGGTVRTAEELRATVEAAFERRADLTPRNLTPGLAAALEDCLALLDSGQLRVAEPQGGGWVVHEWLKKAVLLYFRAHDNHAIDAGFTRFFDKVPLKYAHASEAQLRAGGTRIVPHAIVRRGAYIAPDAVLMPSYVNIGAYVGAGTMVDTWATVGSCAQIGRNVHLSGGVGIGGVLEPLQASPTIIEDDCFIGARSEVVEGVVVEAGSVISMGVFIGQSTRIYDRTSGTILRGRVPAGSVVVSGTLPSADGRCSLYCAVIVKRVDAQTRAKTSINELLRSAE